MVLECVNELSVAMEKLQKSKDELDHVVEGSNTNLQISNTQAWLTQAWISAGLTTEKKCLDGFAAHNLNGKVETRDYYS